jgi:hypothetical protein
LLLDYSKKNNNLLYTFNNILTFIFIHDFKERTRDIRRILSANSYKTSSFKDEKFGQLKIQQWKMKRSEEEDPHRNS